MKKSELKTGMLIELRSGSIAMVLLNTERGDIYSCGHGDETTENQTWGDMSSFNDDLIYSNPYLIPEGDVVKVYGHSSSTGNMYQARISKLGRPVLYDRDAQLEEDDVDAPIVSLIDAMDDHNPIKNDDLCEEAFEED
jgi:hypothetical protein